MRDVSMNTVRKLKEAAPFLPMSRAEMDDLGWDQCDIIIVTGDAYIDHPSFGMAVIGRVLEAEGFRVGIIAQPVRRPAEQREFLKSRVFLHATHRLCACCFTPHWVGVGPNATLDVSGCLLRLPFGSNLVVHG
jgi:hypothetical protein